MVTQHERIPVPSLAMTTRIDSMSRLFELTLGDVRLSREFLFFLVWRNLKARYKQTAIGVIWVLIQPILNMGWFWHCVRRFGFLPGDGGNGGRHGLAKEYRSCDEDVR